MRRSGRSRWAESAGEHAYALGSKRLDDVARSDQDSNGDARDAEHLERSDAEQRDLGAIDPREYEEDRSTSQVDSAVSSKTLASVPSTVDGAANASSRSAASARISMTKSRRTSSVA